MPPLIIPQKYNGAAANRRYLKYTPSGTTTGTWSLDTIGTPVIVTAAKSREGAHQLFIAAKPQQALIAGVFPPLPFPLHVRLESATAAPQQTQLVLVPNAADGFFVRMVYGDSAQKWFWVAVAANDVVGYQAGKAEPMYYERAG